MVIAALYTNGYSALFHFRGVKSCQAYIISNSNHFRGVKSG